MDLMVLAAQQWVNSEYAGRSGYAFCPETGITGWSVMFSLTRALQIELGDSAPDGVFGSGTATRMNSFGPVKASTSNTNMRKIVQAALYCKGYSGGGLDGVWGPSTNAGVQQMLTHMGLNSSPVEIATKIMKSLLTMDAYVCIWNGLESVRTAQQWLNATYLSRRDFQILPCDGLFSRNVQKGVLFALQYSLGMADGTANGVFGPATKSGLSQHSLALGATDSGSQRFVRLFKTLLLCNRQLGVDWASTTYTAATKAVTRTFQTFCELERTGDGNYQTWCSLLVSTGDPERAAEGADCMTPLNVARANALKDAGHMIVGRYIAGGPHKRMTAFEAITVLQAGPRFFPIFQEWNNGPTYFTYEIGHRQAGDAIMNADDLGIPRGSTIYFPCDWDPTTEDINTVVLPYYRGVRDAMIGAGKPFAVGVYGTRNTCQIVSNAGLARTSFVAGMSTGWSGNLGFPLPENWAFDQIATVTLAPGAAGELEIDRNVVSGRDPGVSSLTGSVEPNIPFFVWLRYIEARARQWIALGKSTAWEQWLTAQYIRSLDSKYLSPEFDAICGSVDGLFCAYVNGPDKPPTPILYDSVVGGTSGLAHMGATLCCSTLQDLPVDESSANMHDFGGWAGDLITICKEYYSELSPSDEDAAYRAGVAHMGKDSERFAARDLIADVDAEVAWMAIQADQDRSISSILEECYSSTKKTRLKYDQFVNQRFGSTVIMQSAAIDALKHPAMDGVYGLARYALWAATSPSGPSYDDSYTAAPGVFKGMSRAFCTMLERLRD